MAIRNYDHQEGRDLLDSIQHAIGKMRDDKHLDKLLNHHVIYTYYFHYKDVGIKLNDYEVEFFSTRTIATQVFARLMADRAETA